MYGDALAQPEPPAREGCTFTGWHTDHACYGPWDPAWTMEGDITLYAGWKKTEE